VFLKGLAVLDDTAYFGVCPAAPRAVRGSPEHACDLAAFDLQSGTLAWRRRVGTAGLLNVISAPHLGEGAPYKAAYTGAPLPPRGPGAAGAGGLVARGGEAAARAAAARLAALGFPPLVGSSSVGHPCF
jgi:hypothetical protein